MTFLVTTIDSVGARSSFRRDAADAASLREELKAAGHVVVSLAQADPPSGSARNPQYKFHTSTIPQFHNFLISRLSVEMGLRQISAMLRSGVTLLLALETVAEQAAGKFSRRMWQAVGAKIQKGESLSDAMAHTSPAFDDVAIRLAEVGEKTGELSRTLARAADQLEARRNLRAMVVNALAYPLLAVVVAIAVSAYLVVSVIPKLADFLQAGGVPLPAITQMLMDAADFIRGNAAHMAAGAFAFAVIWCALRFFDATREIQDAFLLRLPVTGRILRLSGTAVFSRSMQIMTESGVTLIDALETSAKLLANRRLRRRVNDALASVVAGRTLDEALAQAKEFMPMMRRMAAVGEVAGSLPDAFAETARFHEMLLAMAVKRFGMLIEPIMIVVTGAIVGFVYIAFFVALFAMANTGG